MTQPLHLTRTAAHKCIRSHTAKRGSLTITPWANPDVPPVIERKEHDRVALASDFISANSTSLVAQKRLCLWPTVRGHAGEIDQIMAGRYLSIRGARHERIFHPALLDFFGFGERRGLCPSLLEPCSPYFTPPKSGNITERYARLGAGRVATLATIGGATHALLFAVLSFWLGRGLLTCS